MERWSNGETTNLGSILPGVAGQSPLGCPKRPVDKPPRLSHVWLDLASAEAPVHSSALTRVGFRVDDDPRPPVEPNSRV